MDTITLTNNYPRKDEWSSCYVFMPNMIPPRYQPDTNKDKGGCESRDESRARAEQIETMARKTIEEGFDFIRSTNLVE